MNIWSNISFATSLLFLLLAAVSLRHGENSRIRNYLVFWFLTLVGLAAAPYYNLAEASSLQIVLQTLLYTLANLTPVSSALLIYLLFEEKDIASPAFWSVAGLAIGLDSFDFWISQAGNWPNDDLLIFFFEYFPQLIKIIYLGLATYALLKSWREDLVQNRFRLRLAILVVGAAIGMEMLVVENLLAINSPLPYDPSRIHASWQFLLAVWLIITFLQPGSIDWASIRSRNRLGDAAPEWKRSWIDWEAKKRELDTLLEQQQIYRDPELNLKSIARELAIPEYRARQLINEELGYKNLRDFLHDHRIAAACRDLADTGKQHLPILTVALDAGYSSLAPFNKAFKERLDQTPSEYRRHHDGVTKTE
jgi:AraC-like DNA-binding protein